MHAGIQGSSRHYHTCVRFHIHSASQHDSALTAERAGAHKSQLLFCSSLQRKALRQQLRSLHIIGCELAKGWQRRCHCKSKDGWPGLKGVPVEGAALMCGQCAAAPSRHLHSRLQNQQTISMIPRSCRKKICIINILDRIFSFTRTKSAALVAKRTTMETENGVQLCNTASGNKESRRAEVPSAAGAAARTARRPPVPVLPGHNSTTSTCIPHSLATQILPLHLIIAIYYHLNIATYRVKDKELDSSRRNVVVYKKSEHVGRRIM